jgi:hypothetical protein
MENRNIEDNECHLDNCTYMKPHRHVHTAYGIYVKYLVEKPDYRKEIKDANPRR